MKIKDVVSRINKSNPWVLNLDELFCEFDFPHYAYQIDSHEFRMYWIQTWMCSDTQVGIAAVFYNDEFIAVRRQFARKSPVTFQWASAEAFEKTRAVLSQMILRYVVVYPEVQNMNEEIDELYQLEFSNQVRGGRKAIWNGMPVEICRLPFRPYKDDPKGFLHNVVIIDSEGDEHTVDIRELMFSIDVKPIEQE
jgi:hypothetical protein